MSDVTPRRGTPARPTDRLVLFRESARLALDVMRAHKARSGLLVLGVAIGVTVLMGMVSIVGGLSRRIETEIRSTDQPVITLTKYDFLTEGDPENPRILARPDLTPEDAEAIEELCPAVGMAEFFVDASRPTILYRGDLRTRPMFVHGAGPRVLQVYSIPTESGRFFTDAEIRLKADVTYLGAGPAEDLFPGVDPLGKRVRIGGHHYTVIGVAKKRKSLFGGMADNFVFVPWTSFKKNLAREREPYYVYMTVAPEAKADDVVEQVRPVMRRRHGLRPGEKDDFALVTNDRVEEFVRRITGPIGIILLAMSSIGLTVGGIGVMNIMLVSVTERTQEIGLRKAVGAQRAAILAQFLIEAATLTGLGGAIGVAAGFLLAWTVSRFSGLPALVHPASAIGGVVFSVFLGIFFGMYPAFRAARLDPIDALRHE